MEHPAVVRRMSSGNGAISSSRHKCAREKNEVTPMRRYLFIRFFAIAGMISLIGGCRTAPETRAIATPSATLGELHFQPIETPGQSAPFFRRAFTKPALGKHMDRKYGTPPPLPDVPVAMERIRPLRVAARIDRRIGDRVLHSEFIFTRSTNHAHVDFKNQEQEWLFLRNPVDNRRVSGVLIDHHGHAVLEYPQGDLLDAGVANGWAEVMSLGLPLDIFTKMVATGKSKTLNGIVFSQYLRKEPQSSNTGIPEEIWWSRDYYLPLIIVRTSMHGSWRQELTQIWFDLDWQVFKAPLKRYPHYTVSDNADWSGCDQNHAAIHPMGLSR